MASWFNLSGTLNAFRVLRDPSLCLPHHTVATFNSLPVPLSSALPTNEKGKPVTIKAVVLDKDNCFAIPHKDDVFDGYKDKFNALKHHYPPSCLLIVSNTAGTSSDKYYAQAKRLEENTGVKVLKHHVKKPGCHDEIMAHFKANGSGVTDPNEIAIVGDRLLTDVMLANTMGSYAFWIRDGVQEAGCRPGLVSSCLTTAAACY